MVYLQTTNELPIASYFILGRDGMGRLVIEERKVLVKSKSFRDKCTHEFCCNVQDEVGGTKFRSLVCKKCGASR